MVALYGNNEYAALSTQGMFEQASAHPYLALARVSVLCTSEETPSPKIKTYTDALKTMQRETCRALKYDPAGERNDKILICAHLREAFGQIKYFDREIRQNFMDFPWAQLRCVRNHLAHCRTRIERDEMWPSIESFIYEELPHIQKRMREIESFENIISNGCGRPDYPHLIKLVRQIIVDNRYLKEFNEVSLNIHALTVMKKEIEVILDLAQIPDPHRWNRIIISDCLRECGEQVQRICDSLKERTSHIPWNDLLILRDAIVHRRNKICSNSIWPDIRAFIDCEMHNIQSDIIDVLEAVSPSPSSQGSHFLEYAS